MALPRRLAAALLAVLAVSAAALIAVVSASGGASDEVVVRALLCAAARKAWERVIEEFERETGIRVVAYYGSSGQLLSMLEAGVEADVFAPAAPRYMVRAVEEGLVDPSTVRPVAFLVPVVAVPAGNPAGVTSLWDLARPGVRIALGEPRSTAIGAYSVELLERAGILSRVLENVVVYADTFSRLASLVAAGAVDAAIAWHVIGYWYPGRVEVVEIPRELVRASWIPIAVTSSSHSRAAAELFVRFVTESPEARRVFAELGYITGLGKAFERASGVEAEWLLAHSQS